MSNKIIMAGIVAAFAIGTLWIPSDTESVMAAKPSATMTPTPMPTWTPTPTPSPRSTPDEPLPTPTMVPGI